MAEQVQAVLDQMVEPLRDLMDRGIFSESEIHSIVSRRRDSEYLLRRRAARKADFLRYLESEMALEKLRSIRTRQVLARQARSKKSDKETKKRNPVGDAHIVSHIHFIFIRLLRKFRSDVSLHLQHAAFAKESKSYTRLGRIYAEALQVHPRNVGLWIEAASHEFFGFVDETTGERVAGGSVQSARVLLQRGLRVNQQSQDLWLQYFALEFHHIQKLRGRREILQIVDEVTQGEESTPAVDTESDALFNEAPIPTLVFTNAIKAIPDSVEFRLKFLELLRLFPQTDVVKKTIVESIERDFGDKPDAWIARANFALENDNEKQAVENDDSTSASGFVVETKGSTEESGESSRKKQRLDINSDSNLVIAELRKATSQLPTCQMILLAIQFSRSYMEQIVDGKVYNDPEKNSQALESTGNFIESLFQQARNLEDASGDLVLEHADYLANQGSLEDAVKVIEDYVSNRSTGSTATLLWINLARLVEQLDPPRSAASVLRRAIKKVPLHDSNHLIVLLELFTDLMQNAPLNEEERLAVDKELWALFQQIILLSARGGSYRVDDALPDELQQHSIASSLFQYIQYSADTGGTEACRKVYTALLKSNFCQPPIGKSHEEAMVMKDIFEYCITLEKTASCNQSKKKERKEVKKRLKPILDIAIIFFQDVDSSIYDSYRKERDECIRFA